MTNVQVTNGVVRYERNVKVADYENKKAAVELSFNIAEGTDVHEAIEHVKGQAIAHCHSMLSVKEGVAETVAVKPAAAKAPKLPKAAAAPKAVEAGVEEDPLSDRAPLPKAVAEAVGIEDPAAQDFVSRQPAAVQAKIAETVKAEPADEDLGDLLGGEEAAKEITDKELTDATQKCQARAKNGPAIRKLLNELGIKTPPGRIIDLPQNQRQDYLNKLEEIKPLA